MKKENDIRLIKSAINKAGFVQKKLANQNALEDVRDRFAIFQCLTFIGEILNPSGNSHEPLSENVVEKLLVNDSKNFVDVRNILSGSIFFDGNKEGLKIALKNDMDKLKETLIEALEAIENNPAIYKPTPFVKARKDEIGFLPLLRPYTRHQNVNDHVKILWIAKHLDVLTVLNKKVSSGEYCEVDETDIYAMDHCVNVTVKTLNTINFSIRTTALNLTAQHESYVTLRRLRNHRNLMVHRHGLSEETLTVEHITTTRETAEDALVFHKAIKDYLENNFSIRWNEAANQIQLSLKRFEQEMDEASNNNPAKSETTPAENYEELLSAITRNLTWCNSAANAANLYHEYYEFRDYLMCAKQKVEAGYDRLKVNTGATTTLTSPTLVNSSQPADAVRPNEGNEGLESSGYGGTLFPRPASQKRDREEAEEEEKEVGLSEVKHIRQS